MAHRVAHRAGDAQVADGAGQKKDEQERKIGIDMEESGHDPISAGDQQGQETAAHTETNDLPDQGQPLLFFAHLSCSANASHLSQRL